MTAVWVEIGEEIIMKALNFNGLMTEPGGTPEQFCGVGLFGATYFLINAALNDELSMICIGIVASGFILAPQS